MTAALRSALTVVVLLNLAFVQLTGAVGTAWLVPMQVLTVASPFCVRLQRLVLWRAGWNLGVLAIFAVLVRDISQSGPRHLLEDGLILAAFCQVHLLNALREDQKPDLLFFNSFLIALVTSFFCQDVAFSLTFALYAFCFVAALALAADRGRRPPLVVVRGSLHLTAAVLVTTGLAFAFLPRDFHREGLVDETALGGLVGAESTGFADRVDLGRSVHTTVDERVVMRIRVTDGEPAGVPSLWRGAALEHYDAYGWRRLEPPRGDDPVSLHWNLDGIGHWSRAGEAITHVVVECEDGSQPCVVAPLEAVDVGVPADALPDAVYARADGVFARQLPPGVRPESWSYSVSIGVDPPRVGRAERASLAAFLRLDRSDPRALPVEAHDLLRDALRGVAADATQAAVVEQCRTLLAGRFDYVLPGRQGAADDLQQFLAGEGGGHCELFATGLALLLRLRGIPCRLATGYLVDEWDPEQGAFVVRRKHAHAWVEVYDREHQTWYAVDATPSADGLADQDADMFGALTASLRSIWEAVTTFDADARGELLRALIDLPVRAFDAARRHPAPASALGLASMLAILALVRRRRRRLSDPVIVYQRALRRLGLVRAPHVTPRELLARARSGAFGAERVADLERATAAHEADRFAVPRFPAR